MATRSAPRERGGCSKGTRGAIAAAGSLFLLGFCVSPADCSSVIWGAVVWAEAAAHARAQGAGGAGSEAFEFIEYPDFEMPIAASAVRNYPQSSAGGRGVVSPSVFEVDAFASSLVGYNPEARATSSFGRRFRVESAEPHQTAIPFSGTAWMQGDRAAVSWTVGVLGQGGTVAGGFGAVPGGGDATASFESVWAGYLAADRWYTLSVSLDGYAFENLNSSRGRLSMSFPGLPDSAYPIPEPATVALLAVGSLLSIAIHRRSR